MGVRLTDASWIPRLKKLSLETGWSLSDEPEVEFLVSLKSGGSTRRKGVRNLHLLYSMSQRIFRGELAEEAWERLAEELEGIRMTFAREAVFLQAGLVEAEGRWLLLPGDEETGLPELLAALEEGGAKVLSDRYAILDLEGVVTDYPERRDSVRVDLVAFTEFSPEIRAFRLKELSPGEASLKLFAQALSARTRTAEAMASVSRFCLQASALAGRRGKPEQAAKTLLKRLQ